MVYWVTLYCTVPAYARLGMQSVLPYSVHYPVTFQVYEARADQIIARKYEQISNSK
jgi:hypothetical protein